MTTTMMMIRTGCKLPPSGAAIHLPASHILLQPPIIIMMVMVVMMIMMAMMVMMVMMAIMDGQIVSSKRGLFGGLTHRVGGSRPHFTSFFSFALPPSDDDDDNEYVVPVRDRMLMQLIIYSEQQLRLIVCYKSTLKMTFYL